MQKLDDLEEKDIPENEFVQEETIEEDTPKKTLKEYEKLLLQDMKRKETQKAIDEVKLGLFEQKEEVEFDFASYTNMTYGKKYKGLYELYQHNETMELVFVCPLIENNKGDENERLDLKPYAYDVLYLEYLDAEAYELVKKAAIHEHSRAIDFLYYSNFALYIALLIFNIVSIVLLATDKAGFTNITLICSTLWGTQLVMTLLLPVLMIQYRKYKAH